MDRSILCCLRKGESGWSWPGLTKERAKLNWLSVDFNKWKDWEDDSEEDTSNFDRFSETRNMGGDEDADLPEVDGADDDSQDSEDVMKTARSGERNVVVTRHDENCQIWSEECCCHRILRKKNNFSTRFRN